eukprot:9978753-Alexandrium_andersonii.AAC.1
MPSVVVTSALSAVATQPGKFARLLAVAAWSQLSLVVVESWAWGDCGIAASAKASERWGIPVGAPPWGD